MMLRLKFVGAAAGGALCFAAFAIVAHGMFVDASNRKQLQDLADQTIRRAVVAVDQVVITLGELISSGQVSCSPDTVGVMRRAVYNKGSIQNIHLYASGGHCSGLEPIEAGKVEPPKQSARQSARNRSITLARTANAGENTLSIAWRLGADTEVVAVASTDALLFDMLPESLREDASLDLVLSNGAVVSHYNPEGWGNKIPDSHTVFEAAGSRYPMTVRITADSAKLAVWNRDISSGVGGLILGLSAVFGMLIAKTFIRRRNPVEELDKAIASGDIVPYFQPIVSLTDYNVVGCEMLARWIKPDGTHVSPAHFIPMAELSGSIDAMTHSLLRQAGARLGREISKRPSFKFTFNVTPEQFLKDGFATSLCELADQAGLPRRQLVVELTERQQLDCGDTARAVTAELESKGVRVAIDDAGTGHNGLSSIQSLGASTLKIDKIFIDRVADDRKTRSLLEMFVSVARDYGMTTVAEGVEHPSQVTELQALGIDDGQGYLFSKPLAAEPFRALLDAESVRALSPLSTRPRPNIVLTHCPPSLGQGSLT